MVRNNLITILLLILIFFFESFYCESQRVKVEFNNNYHHTNIVKIEILGIDTVTIQLPDSVQYGNTITMCDDESCMYAVPFRKDSIFNAVVLMSGNMFIRPILKSATKIRRYTQYNSKLDADEQIIVVDSLYSREVNFKKANLVMYISELPLEYKWLSDTIFSKVKIIN